MTHHVGMRKGTYIHSEEILLRIISQAHLDHFKINANGTSTILAELMRLHHASHLILPKLVPSA